MNCRTRIRDEIPNAYLDPAKKVRIRISNTGQVAQPRLPQLFLKRDKGSITDPHKKMWMEIQEKILMRMRGFTPLLNYGEPGNSVRNLHVIELKFFKLKK
jgi:hypothetical protein